MKEAFSLTIPDCLTTPAQMHLAKMSVGDAAKGLIDTASTIEQWIVRSPDDISTISRDVAWDDSTDPSYEFFSTPRYAYFVDDTALILSEAYGPAILRRMKGVIDKSTEIEWEVLWQLPEV